MSRRSDGEEENPMDVALATGVETRTKPPMTAAPEVTVTARPDEGAAAERPLIEIEGLDLYYGGKQALFGIDLRVKPQQVTAFIGPSGCGKSTLLRCLNRMNDLIDGVVIDGSIRIHGEEIN